MDQRTNGGKTGAARHDNPQHLKKVPGRKSDVSDAAWIAQLLQYGLLQGSFVPGRAGAEKGSGVFSLDPWQQPG